MIEQEHFFAILKISSIAASQFFSFRDFPIGLPLKFKILFAIAPTIIMLSNLGIRFLIRPILVDILDPPTIQVTGFFISVVTFLSALISFSSCKPANDGKNSVILLTEA